jgi:7-carboxy-7-deazaguanine synthase
MGRGDVRYPLAERFFAPQGEGVYAGVPMAFVRLVGCSVGQKVCTHCDTDFSAMHENLGGGLYTPEELVAWAGDYRHVCLTGGEPLDRDLRDLVDACRETGKQVHIETSGTKATMWLVDRLSREIWVTVSPKPGWLAMMIEMADEVKVILGGLGDGPGWPTVEDAVRWAEAGKVVYVQPRNGRHDVDRINLAEALRVVAEHPQLRLSVQLHKFIRTR